MIQLTPIETAGAIITIVAAAYSVHKYVQKQIQPTREQLDGLQEKVDDMSKEIVELTTQANADRQRYLEILHEIRQNSESVRHKLHEMSMNQVEIKTALFGANGTNGIRGELKELRVDVKNLADRLTKIEKDS